MKKNRNIGKFFALSLFVFSVAAVSRVLADPFVHEVNPGECLSEIAHEHRPGPVWGSAGSLHKLLSANPEIRNPDH